MCRYILNYIFLRLEINLINNFKLSELLNILDKGICIFNGCFNIRLFDFKKLSISALCLKHSKWLSNLRDALTKRVISRAKNLKLIKNKLKIQNCKNCYAVSNKNDILKVDNKVIETT